MLKLYVIINYYSSTDLCSFFRWTAAPRGVYQPKYKFSGSEHNIYANQLLVNKNNNNNK